MHLEMDATKRYKAEGTETGVAFWIIDTDSNKEIGLLDRTTRDSINLVIDSMNQRATIAQQAQEIERLKKSLVRMEADRDDARTERNTATIGNRILREKLAALTKERDALADQLADSQASGDTLLWQLGEMKAEREARIKELEQEVTRSTYENAHANQQTRSILFTGIKERDIKLQQQEKKIAELADLCRQAGLRLTELLSPKPTN